MKGSRSLDAVVVGSGPNGLAAALLLARAGLSVEVLEGAATLGGGSRTEELTLPGFRHDTCSTIQSMASLSPFFRACDDVLARRGVRFLAPEIAFAHPMEGSRAVSVRQSVAATAAGLGDDAAVYRRLFASLVNDAPALAAAVLAPLRRPPRHPITMAKFGLTGLTPATLLARRFRTEEGKALVAGVCAHSMLPLDRPLTSAMGLFLTTTAHAGGWPVVEGGSQFLVDALVGELTELGVIVRVDRSVRSLDDVPPARAVLFDTSAASMAQIAGDRLSARYRAGVARYRRGPGVFKVDWALSGPVPWLADECRRAGTVHVGGTFDEVALSESEVGRGRHAERPYCLVVQASVVDATRAPAGHHTLWAYCHVPNGSGVDMSARIEDQIERFAPGFRDLVLARAVSNCTDVERHNPNYAGGDISAGAMSLRQAVFRPTARWNSYRTGTPGLYLCSASTPPGAGVHGMCGMGAANTVLGDLHGRG